MTSAIKFNTRRLPLGLMFCHTRGPHVALCVRRFGVALFPKFGSFLRVGDRLLMLYQPVQPAAR